MQESICEVEDGPKLQDQNFEFQSVGTNTNLKNDKHPLLHVLRKGQSTRIGHDLKCVLDRRYW
jgi:hypothetical protein